MKRILSVLIAALLLFCTLTVTAYAEENAFIHIDDANNVSITLPEDVCRSVTALQVSIVLTNGETVEEEQQFDFNSAFTIQEKRYNENKKTLTLYIADAESLFAGKTTLELGRINRELHIDPEKGPKIFCSANGDMVDPEKYQGGGSGGTDSSAPTPPDPSDTSSSTPSPSVPSSSSPSSSASSSIPVVIPPVQQPPAPDFSALDAVAEQAAQYPSSAYTAESYAALQAALQHIQELKGRADATPEEIENARIALENAIGALVPVNTQVSGVDSTGSSSGAGSLTPPPVISVPNAASSVGAPGAGAVPNPVIPANSTASASHAASSDAGASGENGGASSTASSENSVSSGVADTSGSDTPSGVSSLGGASDSWNEDTFFNQREPASSAPSHIWILVVLIAAAVIMLAAYYFFHIHAGRGQHADAHHKNGSSHRRGRR